MLQARACDGFEAEPFVRFGLDLYLPLERGLALSWPIRLTKSLRNNTFMSSGSPTIHTCGMQNLNPQIYMDVRGFSGGVGGPGGPGSIKNISISMLCMLPVKLLGFD